MSQQYRKKPVVIDAIQWTGSMVDAEKFGIPECAQDLGNPALEIRTLEGTMTAQVGDWIIKGVKGEFYPCKPDIFAATYEPAAAPQAAGAVSIDTLEFQNLAADFIRNVQRENVAAGNSVWKRIVSYADAHAAQRYEAGFNEGLKAPDTAYLQIAQRAEKAEASLARLVEGVQGLKKYDAPWGEDEFRGMIDDADGEYFEVADVLALLPAKAERADCGCEQACETCDGVVTTAPAMGEELPPLPDKVAIRAGHSFPKVYALGHTDSGLQDYGRACMALRQPERPAQGGYCYPECSPTHQAMALRQPGAVLTEFKRLRSIPKTPGFCDGAKHTELEAMALALNTPAAPVSQPAAQEWQTSAAPQDGTGFYAYHPSLVHPDFNPWGVVEAVYGGEAFIGAVWNGQHDYWDTTEIQVAAWKPISGPNLPLSAPAGSEQEKIDAARWNALLNSPRIRMLGSAGLNRPEPNNYAHFGMEIWSRYSRDYSEKLLDEMDKGNAQGREWLTKYADIALAAQQKNGAANPVDEYSHEYTKLMSEFGESNGGGNNESEPFYGHGGGASQQKEQAK